MKSLIKITFLSFMFVGIISAQQEQQQTFDNNEILKEIADNACQCIDSLHTSNKPYKVLMQEISDCIDKEVMSFQIIDQTNKIMLPEENNKEASNDSLPEKMEINIVLAEKGTKQYDKYYRRLENYLMENCPSLKKKVAANDELERFGVSQNPEAYKYYVKAIDYGDAKEYKKAIKYYKKALKIDPDFPFAWDNLGLVYRKTEQYDKALEAYAKSMELMPGNRTPIMNSAVVYTYKKEWDKAIQMYKKLVEIDESDPEIYYGIAQVYAHKKELEKALDNMCKAYNLYLQQESPYRSDAEKFISYVYYLMKEEGKEDKFYEILKKNNIKAQKE